MNVPLMLLLIILGLVVVFAILLGFIPKLRSFLFPSSKSESTKQKAQEAVEEIIRKDPRDSLIDEKIKEERFQTYLLQKEKELGFVLSDDDIEPLIIQLKQDEIDSGK